MLPLGGTRQRMLCSCVSPWYKWQDEKELSKMEFGLVLLLSCAKASRVFLTQPYNKDSPISPACLSCLHPEHWRFLPSTPLHTAACWPTQMSSLKEASSRGHTACTVHSASMLSAQPRNVVKWLEKGSKTSSTLYGGCLEFWDLTGVTVKTGMKKKTGMKHGA